MTDRSEAYEAAAKMVGIAADALIAAGFERTGISGQGDAQYFTRGGAPMQIRLATYGHGHFNTVQLVFSRDRCMTGWYLTDAEITAEVTSLIAEYEAALADMGDDDDDDEAA